jgi:hypothetical protein
MSCGSAGSWPASDVGDGLKSRGPLMILTVWSFSVFPSETHDDDELLVSSEWVPLSLPWGRAISVTTCSYVQKLYMCVCVKTYVCMRKLSVYVCGTHTHQITMRALSACIIAASESINGNDERTWKRQQQRAAACMSACLHHCQTSTMWHMDIIWHDGWALARTDLNTSNDTLLHEYMMPSVSTAAPTYSLQVCLPTHKVSSSKHRYIYIYMYILYIYIYITLILLQSTAAGRHPEQLMTSRPHTSAIKCDWHCSQAVIISIITAAGAAPHSS